MIKKYLFLMRLFIILFLFRLLFFLYVVILHAQYLLSAKPKVIDIIIIILFYKLSNTASSYNAKCNTNNARTVHLLHLILLAYQVIISGSLCNWIIINMRINTEWHITRYLSVLLIVIAALNALNLFNDANQVYC